jgi:hypothetical protein
MEGMGVGNERGDAPGNPEGIGKGTGLFGKGVWTNFINISVMGIKLINNS